MTSNDIHLQVELDLFSGRKNPSWVLTENQAKEFLDLSGWHEMIATEETERNLGMGYNGFVFTQLSENSKTHLPQRFRIINPYREHYQLRHFPKLHLDDKEMIDREKWILKSSGKFKEYEDVWPYMENYLKKIKHDKSKKSTQQKKEKKMVGPCKWRVLEYNPDWWNYDINRRWNNNCYNYATNYASNTFAQPGRYSGREFSKFSCNNVSQAAKRDGMIDVGNCNPSNLYYYIALVIAPKAPQDYHWYRCVKRDGRNFFGHKPGSTNVINYDASGNLITDVETCNRDYWPSGGPNYSDFCSYFAWPENSPVI